jgi:hypothetical protein
VVRERVVELVNGEQFLEPVLLGGRAGGGGMTSRLLLKDNIGGDTWMLQCCHGYGAIDEDCFYPPQSGIKAAVDQVEDTVASIKIRTSPVTRDLPSLFLPVTSEASFVM